MREDRNQDRRYGAQKTGAGRRTWPNEGEGPRVGRMRTDVPRARRAGSDDENAGGRYEGNRAAGRNRSYDRNGERPYERKNERTFDRSGERTYEKRTERQGSRSFGGPAGRRPYQPFDDEVKDPKKRNALRREQEAELTAFAEPDEIAELPEALPEDENLLVGRNPIREALKAGRPVEKLLVANGDLSGAAREIVHMAREAGAIVQTVDRARLDQVYPAHQGMIAYVAAVPYSTVDAMLESAAEKGEEPFLILLDGITDPHNLGAIVRSAECVGAHGVIIPERRSAGLTPAAAKAAAGALNHMPIARVTNLNRTIEELKEKGVWIIGTAMNGTNAFKTDLSGPAALVIGSEGDGMSRLTMEKCDLLVSLPMKGHIDSLNASVAAGVMMYEIVRARSK